MYLLTHAKIVDFCIWLLFSRETAPGRWPKHLICDGYRRTKQDGDHISSTIPGIFQYFPNTSVGALKDTPWTQVLALLGQSGERVMIDLLVDCSIYLEVQSGYRNYFQLSGMDEFIVHYQWSSHTNLNRSAFVRDRIQVAKCCTNDSLCL